MFFAPDLLPVALQRATSRAFVAALLAFGPLLAAPAHAVISVWLEDQTWTELQSQIKAGATTVIVPIGGTEQSGPLMALGKHNVRVKLLAEKIAHALGNTLVAPVIAYVPEGAINPPTEHMKFPGTITIPDAVFDKTLESAAKSLMRAGFIDIVLIGDHGGYQKLENAVAARLNAEWKRTPARVHAISEYYRAAEVAYPQALREKGFSAEEIGTHAGLADTSLMLALDPRQVRSDDLRDMTPKADLGVYGDPRRAAAALGKIGVDLIVSQSVAAIKEAIARHQAQ